MVSKGLLFTNLVLWIVFLPIVVIAIGFGGTNLFSPSAVVREISEGRWLGIPIRGALFLYIIAPALIIRSYSKKKAQGYLTPGADVR